MRTLKKWVLPARAEATTRSTATVLETSIAPQMTAVKGTTGQSALGEEKETMQSFSTIILTWRGITVLPILWIHYLIE